MMHDTQSLLFIKIGNIYKLFLTKNSFISNRFVEENCCIYGTVIYYVFSVTTANIILHQQASGNISCILLIIDIDI